MKACRYCGSAHGLDDTGCIHWRCRNWGNWSRFGVGGPKLAAYWPETKDVASTTEGRDEAEGWKQDSGWVYLDGADAELMDRRIAALWHRHRETIKRRYYRYDTGVQWFDLGPALRALADLLAGRVVGIDRVEIHRVRSQPDMGDACPQKTERAA